MNKRRRKRRYYLLFAVILLFVFGWVIVQPSNNRDWSPDQQVLPKIHIAGDRVELKNIRSISYRSSGNYTLSFYDKSFDLNKLVRVWYMVELLSDSWGGVAHTLLSYEFEGPEFIAISVELRKETGEKFSPLKGLFRQYELMYVIADEQDVIKLRTNHRKHRVYLYPVNASAAHVKTMFLHMLRRAQKLQREPEFYNTLINSCTTNIVDHIRTIVPDSIPLSLKVLFPGYSDELAYDLGLIDNSLSFAEMRRRHLVSDRARKHGDKPDFSRRIREFE